MNCLKCNKSIQIDQAKHGLHKECFNKEFRSNEDFSYLIPKATSSDPTSDKLTTNMGTSYFHGAFKKYSTMLGSKNYILKVIQDDYPELPIVEYVSNQIARELGVEVPEFHYIIYNNTIPTFVTRNFLDFHQGSNLVHIWHYLSGETGLELEKKFNCETLLETILMVTGKPKYRKKFIEICLFDMIIGNHDRHGRNLAVIETGSKKILSPCYDNPSYIGIESPALLDCQLSPRGKIFTKDSTEPTLADYITEFKRLDFESIVDSFMAAVKEDKICKIVEESDLTQKRKEAFIKLIKTNIEMV